MSNYTVVGANDSPSTQNPQQAFADEVLIGLNSSPKRLPSRFFYDDRGSQLFRKITELDEYYPTRCEREIFQRAKTEIADVFGSHPMNLIDLGAGDGSKTCILLQELLSRGVDVTYVPIDISEQAMRMGIKKVSDQVPGVRIHGLVADYFAGLRWLSTQTKRHNALLFLGSNIGNFGSAMARAFLHRMWNALNPNDHVLIGFDMKKDIDVLLAAYNDRDQVTAEFNLNLLDRINAELGGTFERSNFRHFSTYNVFSGAMESYLVSQANQTVFIKSLDQSFSFDAWEPIHTEYSYKFLMKDIERLAGQTQYKVEAQWLDDKHWFCDALWRVKKHAG